MTKDEALRLALEALEYEAQKGNDNAYQSEREAIKAALEAKDEPNYKKALEAWLDKTEWVQETVKPHELGMHRADVLKQRILEASPQRTWVGLTDEEIEQGCKESWITEQAFQSAVWWAEAKLKEKNT
jgi:hypothetical protein